MDSKPLPGASRHITSTVLLRLARVRWLHQLCAPARLAGRMLCRPAHCPSLLCYRDQSVYIGLTVVLSTLIYARCQQNVVSIGHTAPCPPAWNLIESPLTEKAVMLAFHVENVLAHATRIGVLAPGSAVREFEFQGFGG